MQEKQVRRQLVVCGHDTQKTCWHPGQLFSNIGRSYLLGKFGPSLLKASGLQIPRKAA